MIIIKSRIKELRKNNKYSQKFIADYLNISQPQYSKIESYLSNITFDKLDKLAILYNTSVDYLLYRTDIDYPYPERQKKIQD